MELSGRLISFPIAELLHWAHNDRRTGSLVVRRTGREKRIFFKKGQIVACHTDSPAEYYGQHLLLNGYLDRDTLYRCLSACKKRKLRLGVVLREEDILDLDQIQRTLRFQIEDLICDIFLWNHGIFVFQNEPPPDEDILAEPIATLGLSLEGARWEDEMGRIRKVFVHDNLLMQRTDKPLPADVTPRKRYILQGLQGLRSVAQLYEVVRGSYFRFLTALHELHGDGHVAIVDARSELLPTAERPLADLLLEQAVEEQTLESRRDFMSSLVSFERFVPVWVRPPESAEWDRMPAAARDFYRKLDGSRRLHDILSAERDAWIREIELLMLQLGKETVALLPAPIAELTSAADKRSPVHREWWRKVFG